MFLVVSFVICTSLVVLWVLVRLKYHGIMQKIKNMDETKHIPILGSAYLFIGKLPEDIFKLVIDNLLKAGSPCKTWLVSKLIVTVRYSDDVQRVLSSPYCYEKGSGYELLNINNGLLTAKPKIWRVHRKLLNSTFHVALLNDFFKQFNDVSKLLVADLRDKVGGASFDTEPYVGYRIVELQLKTIFDANVSEQKTRTIFENIKIVLSFWGEKLLKFYTSFLFAYITQLFKIEPFEKKIFKNNYKHLKPIIDSARKQYFGKLKSNSDKIETNGKVKNTPELFIHRLVKLMDEGHLSENHFQDHVHTMLLAGGDTLTVAISNCMLCLAMNPKAQDNCAKEIKEVMGENFEMISIDDLTKLNLLDRTVNECLRLLPTVPLIFRVNEKDIELNNNKVIPAGTEILIPITVIHLCKEYWGENSTTFNPDNFLPENKEKRPLLSFIPYSYGLRNCIARKYSFNAMKIFIAYLVVNYRLSTDLKYEQLKLAFGITTILRNKHMIRIEKR